MPILYTTTMITERDEKGRIAKGSNLKHGLSKDPLFDCWISMKARCLKPHHPAYQWYGGRGIKICDRWLESFENFYADMGQRPTSKHTLDRIDPDGDYEPENCRWITHHRQQMNKRIRQKVVGVTYEPYRNKYRADICINGKKNFLGRFKDFDDAVKARYEAEQQYAI